MNIIFMARTSGILNAVSIILASFYSDLPPGTRPSHVTAGGFILCRKCSTSAVHFFAAAGEAFFWCVIFLVMLSLSGLLAFLFAPGTLKEKIFHLQYYCMNMIIKYVYCMKS